MRLVALGALLFAVYAATLSIPAAGREDYAGDELHYLLAARSWVEDGDLDLANQYAQRQWREFTDRELQPSGTLVLDRLREPQGVGMPLAISPAYALGGAGAVALMIAALTALAFVLAAALARRIVPEPWASAGVLVAGLSPPALAAATTVSPEPVAAALIAGASLCAVKVRESARLRHAYAGAVMLAVLPWLDPALAVAGLPAAFCLVRWTLREGRRLVALVTAELMLGSLVFYARLNETLFGGPLPSAAAAAPAEDAAGIAGRAVNLVGLWLAPGAGLLRWAPVFALAFVGAWLLARSRREHVAAAIPARREAERVAELLVATVAAQWLVAAFTIDELDGDFFPGLPLFAAVPAMAALAAWGLRHTRVAGAVLAAVTLALSVWLVGDALSGAEGWLGAAR
ncbi:MAG TPA: hypothetical protein VFN44_24315 [Solirubrobacteraceae bacterium]|nr:hypothetical protein [Solirubrobacteraceae bacterium]